MNLINLNSYQNPPPLRATMITFLILAHLFVIAQQGLFKAAIFCHLKIINTCLKLFFKLPKLIKALSCCRYLAIEELISKGRATKDLIKIVKLINTFVLSWRKKHKNQKVKEKEKEKCLSS